MKKAVLLIGLLVSMVSLSGCLEEQQGTSDQQPTWQYKCLDGTWVEDPDLCTDNATPAAGEVRKLLEKPLAEYALSLAEVPGGYLVNEEYTRYFTIEELLGKDAVLHEQLASKAVQEYYASVFQKGTGPVPPGPESAVVQELIKFDNIEDSKEFFAWRKEDWEESLEFYPGIAEFVDIPTKGDESYAIQIYNPPVYSIFFRIKNISYGIDVVRWESAISIEDALHYVGKVIEKMET